MVIVEFVTVDPDVVAVMDLFMGRYLGVCLNHQGWWIDVSDEWQRDRYLFRMF